MTKKKGKTAKKKEAQKGGGKYGTPIYLVINTSSVTAGIKACVECAIEEANEYKSTLYLTINSGNPPPPPCPPNNPLCL